MMMNGSINKAFKAMNNPTPMYDLSLEQIATYRQLTYGRGYAPEVEKQRDDGSVIVSLPYGGLAEIAKDGTFTPDRKLFS